MWNERAVIRSAGCPHYTIWKDDDLYIPIYVPKSGWGEVIGHTDDLCLAIRILEVEMERRQSDERR